MKLEDKQFNNLNVLANAVEIGTTVVTEVTGTAVGDRLVNEQGRQGIAQMILARIRQRHANVLGV